jgi:hypothetical protein
MIKLNNQRCKDCDCALEFILNAIEGKIQIGKIRCPICGCETKVLEVELELAFRDDPETFAVKCAGGGESIVPRLEVEEFLSELVKKRAEDIDL